MSLWPVYTGTSEPHDGIERLPPPPPWRDFNGGPALPTPAEHSDEAATSPDRAHRARTYRATAQSVDLVNAALYLRRPLLVTGPPGSGKSSLAYAVARELRLGPVLRWNITSRATLHDGLYQYDPLSRLYAAGRTAAGWGPPYGGARESAGAGGTGRVPPPHPSPPSPWPWPSAEPGRYGPGRTDADGTPAPAPPPGAPAPTVPPGAPKPWAPAEADLQEHLRLGPLGTALLPYERPRVLLIDEIDKSDLDLPNDLLNVLEEGQYEIPELVRAARRLPEAEVMVDGTDDRVTVARGRVRCRAFPFTVLTSNGEREFPPAFLRRCVQLRLRRPDDAHLTEIVRAHLGEPDATAQALIDRFLSRGSDGELATDQLLNAIYLTGAAGLDAATRDDLAEQLMPYLSRSPDDDEF